MFFLSLIAMLPFTHGFYTQACIRFYGQLSDKGIMACLLGGAIMGSGMALAGSVSRPIMILYVLSLISEQNRTRYIRLALCVSLIVIT